MYFAPCDGAHFAHLDGVDPPGVARLVPQWAGAAAAPGDSSTQEAEPNDAPRLRIACIDVGMQNLGVAIMSFDNEWRCPRIEHIERVDLTALDRELAPECFAGNEPRDRVERFIALFGPLLATCRQGIYIERQPVAGLKAVEQLLYKAYEGHAHLVSPNAIHAALRYGKRDGYEYADRKRFVTALSDLFVARTPGAASPGAIASWHLLDERRHDVADAIVIGLWCGMQQRRATAQQGDTRGAPQLSHARGAPTPLGRRPARGRNTRPSTTRVRLAGAAIVKRDSAADQHVVRRMCNSPRHTRKARTGAFAARAADPLRASLRDAMTN
jgi:hypothetical protein